ncbi:hypothetical protein HII12_002800 [Brettanomyces bruxellensis]|uniref:1-phosphatidylinositol 4-kinase n=1 Tax=Dekkera bruxellensis TaxID=5007 RepID=A0A8H6BFT8_DEKBR|nr:hypothetical protein HII12_002800 [Brettanomyces bruxellensis]
MDFYGTSRESIRVTALERLTQLTVEKTNSAVSLDKAVSPGFKKILERTRPSSDNFNEPISQIELDTLFALCRSSKHIRNKVQAEILFSRFERYLIDAKYQKFQSGRSTQNAYPNIRTKIAYELTNAIACLGLKFSTLRQEATETLQQFLLGYRSDIDLHASFALVGFLQGLVDNAKILSPQLIEDLLNLFKKDNFYKEISSVADNVSVLNDVNWPPSVINSNYDFSFLLFVHLLGQVCIELFKNMVHVPEDETLTKRLLKSDSVAYNITSDDKVLIKDAVDGYSQCIKNLENKQGMISISSSKRVLYNNVKAISLDLMLLGYVASVVPFKCMSELVVNYMDSLSQLRETGTDQIVEEINSDLMLSTFSAAALLSESDRKFGLLVTKSFPVILSYPIIDEANSRALAQSLTFSLKTLSEDEVVSCIYSLTNLLPDPITTNETKDTTSNGKIPEATRNTTVDGEDSDFATSNNAGSHYLTREAQEVMCKNVVGVILEISKEFSDESINILVITLLSQKIRKVPDEFNCIFLESLVDLVDVMKNREFSIVLRFFYEAAATCKPDSKIGRMTMHVWVKLSEKEPLKITDKSLMGLFRDAWFNLCVHGFTYNSPRYKKDYLSLRRIAYNTPALASDLSWNRSETSIELNTVLRRASSKQTEKTLQGYISAKVFETQVSRPGLIFLSTNLLVEMLRVDCGNCSTCLEYLSDPSVTIAHLDTFVGAIAYFCCSQYINRMRVGGSSQFTVKRVTGQLQQLFIYCCHRDQNLQTVAFQCANRIITLIPSSLCHEKSAFSMLDILTLLYNSIVDADTHEYEPNIIFVSDIMGIKLTLSDSYQWRKQTLNKFSSFAEKSISLVLSRAEQDMTSILYAYLKKTEQHRSGMKYGADFALKMTNKAATMDQEYYKLGPVRTARHKLVSDHYGAKSSTVLGKDEEQSGDSFEAIDDRERETIGKLSIRVSSLKEKHLSGVKITHSEVVSVMNDITSAIAFTHSKVRGELVRWASELPFWEFTSQSIDMATNIWLGIMKDKPEASAELLSEIILQFELSVGLGIGLYSRRDSVMHPAMYPMLYLPTRKEVISHFEKTAEANIRPHLDLIRLLHSHFQSSKFESDHTLKLFTDLIVSSLKGLIKGSEHPYARLARFELIKFAISILKAHLALSSRSIPLLINLILDAALSWFSCKAKPPFGSNKLRTKAEYSALVAVAKYFSEVTFNTKSQEQKRNILLMFLDSEIAFLYSWLHPRENNEGLECYSQFKFNDRVMSDAFFIDGRLAVNLFDRYGQNSLDLRSKLEMLINKYPFKVIEDACAVNFLASTAKGRNSSAILVWGTFFYVPQIVQTLRYDKLGYIRRYILETANVSPLFAHQIIWNMSANSYKDEDCKIPDTIKPTLDNIKNDEFSFFDAVTNISGKLKPYIRKSKAEKKRKIDEEMMKIKLQDGVYLPSNPDGVVVDIDRKSGKPLQSHAKAPFMATFKIRRKVDQISDDNSEEISDELNYETVNLGAIFKVGDDCRQDVLVIQLMAIFRTMWMTAGLDVYVYPYRVTATAPGCGIIDVLPNSISRDMLGREAVNGLYEYFITQFGPETSPEFQKARNNFVKSMASYSIITYLLAIKDRHNGNIMYDNQGHVLHVDFGFCFDIAPGGVTFEQSPFKLTKEMVKVMGGSTDTQAFKWFEELCVKSFLVCREHMDMIIAAVMPMLDSGLPCFKNATIKHLKARFVPERDAEGAAAFMRGLVKKSYLSVATKTYDEFQRLTNGIPY